MEPRRVRYEPGSGEKGGPETGPNPTDRGRKGSKYHLLTEGRGLPLVILLSAANVHDKKRVFALFDTVPPIKGPRGRPRRRPSKAHGDKSYDFADVRHGLRLRHIIPRIARRGVESSERLGRYRWVVERTFSWLLANKRLRIREEVDSDMLLAFLQLGCSIVLFRELTKGF